MRRWTYLDLELSALGTLVALVLQLAQTTPLLRIPLTLMEFFLWAGYGLFALIYPARQRPEPLVQLFVIPLYGTALSGLTLIVLGLRDAFVFPLLAWAPAGVILAVLLAAGWRRRRLPEAERFALAPTSLRSIGLYSLGGVLIALVLLEGEHLFAYRERYTTFFLLGPGGRFGNYPTQLTPHQKVDLRAGLQNEEGRALRYQLVVQEGSAHQQLLTPLVAPGHTYLFPPLTLPTHHPGPQELLWQLYRVGSSKPLATLSLRYTVR
jgi:uncharacterized membrane protein